MAISMDCPQTTDNFFHYLKILQVLEKRVSNEIFKMKPKAISLGGMECNANKGTFLLISSFLSI